LHVVLTPDDPRRLASLSGQFDEHLPQMVDEHVKREISRITGRPL
jgi:hypothetical protein